MSARIELAEILSFRLKLTRAALDQIVANATEVPVKLECRDDELVLSTGDGSCFIKFHAVDQDVVLTEVSIERDERGWFFHRILGMLMTRYQGDLHAKLRWNDSDRNTQGDYAEVRIQRGRSSYPGLSRTTQALRNTLVAAASEISVDNPPSSQPADLPFEDDSTASSELDEIARLLARAKLEWEEYQRLKRGPV